MTTSIALKRESSNNYNWQVPPIPLNRTPLAKPSFNPTGFPQLNQINNELLLSLSKETFLQLQPEMRTVYFERGQTIYGIGDPFDFIYFPNNMVASRLALMEDGAMIEVGVVGREGLLGVAALIGASSANNMTVAETDGSAIRIRAKVLRDIFRHDFKLQSLLLGYYHDFLTQISQRAACRCRHSVAQQLCTWLLQVHDRAGTNDLALTQETIANRLGARRASITVAINELEKAALLRCKRGHIVICNRGGLENQACECYGLLSYSFENSLQSSFIQ
ncbi:MAG: Crp/Fnr family transcriptional regulator [Pyrinomonadaceae bacterium]